MNDFLDSETNDQSLDGTETDTLESDTSADPSTQGTGIPLPQEQTPVNEPPEQSAPTAQTSVATLTPDESKEGINPDALSYLAPDIVKLPYKEGIEKLTTMYKNTKWTDPEIASQKFASVADALNKRYGVETTPKLDSDAVFLTHKLMDVTLNDTQKLDAIESWRKNAKERLFNSSDTEALIGGANTEQLIDSFASHYRRTVMAGDKGFITNALAHGADAMISPLVGTADVMFGTESQKQVRSFLERYENPNRDDGISAAVGSGVGSVGGFVASAFLGPEAAFGYLGATIVSQAKDVYDEAYAKTKSTEQAKDAVLRSAPGIALGAFAHKAIGGPLGTLLKGEPGGFGSVLHGIAVGAGGAVGQAALTGEALASATGKSEFRASPEALAVQGLVGASLGALPTIIGKVFQESPKTVNTRAQVKEALSDTKPASIEPSYIRNMVESDIKNLPSDSDGAKPVPEIPKDALAYHINEQTALPQEDSSAQTFDSDVLNSTSEVNTPVKTLPISYGYTPSIFMQEFVRRLDSAIAVQDLPAGYFGFYHPGTNKVMLNRNIFKDQAHAYSTMAHEVGHFFDAYRVLKDRLSSEMARPLDNSEARLLAKVMHAEPLVEKFIALQDVLNKGISPEEIFQDAKKLSLEWRPPFTDAEVDSEYRNRNTEVQADVFSAILNNPDMVRVSYPKIWEMFELSLLQQPELRTFWGEVTDYQHNPAKVLELTQQRMEMGRIKEAEIVQKSAIESVEDRKGLFKERVERAFAKFKSGVVNRFGAARLEVNKTMGAERVKAFEAFNDLYSQVASRQKIAVEIDGRLNKLMQEYDQLGIPGTKRDPDATWKTYATFDRILNETTPELETIKRDPKFYAKVGQQIADMFAAKNKTIIDKTGFKGIDFNAETPAEIEQNLAKIHAANFNPDQLNTMRKLLVDSKLSDDEKGAGLLLLNPDTFNVRKYLANPDVDARTAEIGMASLKAQLGPEKFKALAQTNAKMHNILAEPLFKSLEQSQIFSPNVMRRMKLNKNNYLTFNILKYFEKDPNFDARVRKQYGTLEQMGDVLASTYAKTKAIYGYSEYQKAQNAAVNIALSSNYESRLVEPALRFSRDVSGKSVAIRENVFTQKERLSKENPDKSYLIKFQDGNPSLYEINSPIWKEMFSPDTLAKSPALAPFLQAIDGYHKLFLERQLKTVLNPVFWLRQKFIDTANEAIYARKFAIPGLPFHVSKSLRELKQQAAVHAEAYLKGEFTPEITKLLEGGALAFNHGGEFGQMTSTPAENIIRARLGVPIPNEEEGSIAHRITKSLAEKLNNSFFGPAIKEVTKPVETLKDKLLHKVEYDEARTKVMGYLIAKNLKGLSDAEAIAHAREYFGTPDVFGGGTNAASINKLFLFGRAHVNGLRAVASQFKADPKGYSIQYAYHKFIPRILTSSVLMTPIISALFGDDEGQKYKKFLDKIPTFDKAAKLIVPLGFMDGNGNFKGFDVRSDQITPDWKARYLRLPLARELYTIDQLVNPAFAAFEDLVGTGTISAKHIAQNSLQALGSVFVGNVSPAIQGTFRTAQLIGGYNPYDFYRNRGVLPKDVAEAGSMLQKTYEYLLWSAFATAPGIFSSTLKQMQTDSLDPVDYVAKVPMAGSLLKGFIGSTNYGDFEVGLKSQQAKQEMDSDIRLNLQDETKKLYNQFTKYGALTSRMGKGWETKVGPDLATKIHAINKWHANVYKHAFNELRSSFETGDDAQTQKISDSLEEISASYAKNLEAR